MIWYYWIKEVTVLRDVMNRLIEIGSCYGMKISLENTKVMKL